MDLRIFVILSLIVHLIFFLSVFDIYFTSPIVHGVKEFKQTISSPASRLVLFVADGLRADKFFELDENENTRAPFLRTILTNHGMWGVSHTRVPTESRPGHVAMIAGFYEDVFLILMSLGDDDLLSMPCSSARLPTFIQGWKENPVEFDSVFNKSRNTWAFGSPDILPMFAKGSSAFHVHIHCYAGDIESFAGIDSSLLDDWVFDKFSQFLEDAHSNLTLSELLHQDKIVFFLHLLGIDTNGHSHKPSSKEYLENIRKVDEGIKNAVKLIEDFYSNDKKTAFVFTSDHGMTNWGSHGAGLPAETLTPLVVWGAGAEIHDEKRGHLSHNDYQLTRTWNLDPSSRHDVNQADIAPLMSSLVGLPIPVNSVGVLPLPFLSLDNLSKAKLMLTNARQIAEQYKVKLDIVKKNSFYFKPFSTLPLSKALDMERQIEDYIVDRRAEDAINTSLKLIELSLEGVQYYHTYHRTSLYFVVILGFVGWMILTSTIIVSEISFVSDQANKAVAVKNHTTISIFFIAFAILLSVTLYLFHVPSSYFLYFMLPLPIYYYITLKKHILFTSVEILTTNLVILKKLLLYITIGMIGIWILVLSFFYRILLTLELIFFALSVFPLNISPQTKLQWFIICILSSIFPLLPVVGREANSLLVVLGGVCGSIFSNLVEKSSRSYLSLLPLFSGCLAATTSTISSHQGHVPIVVHVISWSTLVLSWVFPLCTSTKLVPRMWSIYVCHCSVAILISLSYDALFSVLFTLLLVTWSRLEVELSDYQHYEKEIFDFQNIPLSLDSVHESSFAILRRSYALLFFFVFAFFGVGNIASVNSFDVRIVLPFITVFKPFVMGGLLAYKVLLPYLLVVCTFCCLAVTTRTSLRQLFCVGLMISDIMGMHFFFMVKDHGSWLDIGTSISHYVISMSMVMSLLLFFGAAKFLTCQKIFR